MALRVLLADESSTIKKAIQMVLSEYGVEVKTVPTGIDVLSVTQTFIPDIVIADILLNKKNGYEVSLELKNNENTKKIPVILMWSSFMQLDQQLFKNSKADASLEKPFEPDVVRTLFEKLVPKLKSFPLRGFLNHAVLPDFEESDTFVRQKTDFNTLANKNDLNPPILPDINSFPQPPPITRETLVKNKININTPVPNAPVSIKQKMQQKLQQALVQRTELTALTEETESQQQIQNLLQQLQSSPESQPEAEPPQESAPQKERSEPQNDEMLSPKKSQIFIETENFGDFEEVKLVSTIDDEIPDLQKKINAQVQSYLKDFPNSAHSTQMSSPNSEKQPSFDEQLLKEEIRQTVEKICWQLIPEITEKVVREELGKLLQGIEKNL